MARTGTLILVIAAAFASVIAESGQRENSAAPEESSFAATASSSSSTASPLWHSIEGKIVIPGKKPTTDWLTHAQVLVNGGENIGFVKEDGTFLVTGVAAGSHIIEIVHPQLQYEAARVDITSKGKIRARKVNHLQPSQVSHLPYPLRLTATGAFKYFQTREQWRVTDVLMSPMVLMMVLPLILIVILPKMMSDPETRREMENVQLPKYEMPEMSEMLTSFFGGGDSDKKKAVKKKN